MVKTYAYKLILENDTYELTGWISGETKYFAKLALDKMYARPIVSFELELISEDHKKWLWNQVDGI